MKKLILITCAASLMLVGCDKSDEVENKNKENNIVVTENKEQRMFKDVSLESMQLLVKKRDTSLNEVERIINDGYAGTIERMDAEGVILYKCENEELEIGKGIEGLIDYISYNNKKDNEEISYGNEMEIPMIKVSKEYTDIVSKEKDISKLSSTEMQKDYMEITRYLKDKIDISEIKEETGLDFEEVSSEEDGVKNYSCSNDIEGITIKTINGIVEYVGYSNIPDNEKVDVRNYSSEINEKGQKIYSVDIYRDTNDIKSVKEIMKIIK